MADQASSCPECGAQVPAGSSRCPYCRTVVSGGGMPDRGVRNAQQKLIQRRREAHGIADRPTAESKPSGPAAPGGRPRLAALTMLIGVGFLAIQLTIVLRTFYAVLYVMTLKGAARAQDVMVLAPLLTWSVAVNALLLPTAVVFALIGWKVKGISMWRQCACLAMAAALPSAAQWLFFRLLAS